jgi:catechol 2,3-dioxygenase-like lactoylglutathione lyase family enzyme
VQRLGHVGLRVRDLETSVAFYSELLGLRESDRLTYPAESSLREAVWMRCDADHHCLALFNYRETAAHPPAARAGLDHIAFQVGSYDDVLTAYRALRARDHSVTARVGGPGWNLRIYFHDPDGHQVEVYWDLDQIGWDGHSRPHAPIEVIDLESLDVDAYLARKAAFGASDRIPLAPG